jgi:DNA-directed RNA polymerase subunit RPC12/RpoP
VEGLTLSLSRDWGYSSGTGRIQGRFSMKVNAPTSVTRVVFLIDGQVVGEDTEPPFKFQFHTADYALGVHVLSAIGYTTDGRQLQSNEIRRQFVTAEESWKSAIEILVPVMGITFAILLLAFVFPVLVGRGKKIALPPGTRRTYGWLGGTICPKCGRPFSLHFWSLNMGLKRLDRCPYCGNWSLVRARSLQELRAAEEAELASTQTPGQTTAASAEERLRQELEDSRYQDI